VRLYQNKLGKYVVYDKRGKVVIITVERKLAIAYARKIND
jgi:hypothetical protein|tara:strand:- start:647 stop:766 length:120 start_codon:yes stop_codon:yes gene_type:complete